MVTKATKVTLAEMETILRWDREERIVHVWSADPVTWRRMAKLGIEPSETTRFRDSEIAGRFYSMPLADFRWGRKRTVTEAERARKAVLLAKARVERGVSCSRGLIPHRVSST